MRPRLLPLASYDAALAKVAALVPGDGDLATRVEAYLDHFTIPKPRLQKTLDAAIARCRGRSAAHIAMPEGESFRLEFVTGKSWSGYNYYQGGYHSLIQANTGLPGILVGIHMMLAAMLAAAMTAVILSLKAPAASAESTPASAVDAVSA